MTNPSHSFTELHNVGVSLRSQHFSDFLNAKQPVDWLEIVADQYLHSRGILLERLQRICADYPINLHCVSFSLGGTDPIDPKYLQSIKVLANLLQPHYVSDHLCWSSHNGEYSHDLLPLPYTQENIDYIACRIQQVQEALQRPLLLENLSHYVQLDTHETDEATCLNTLCQLTGCGILLDINNIFVSSQNLQLNPKQFIDTINPTHVKQCHLAGHSQTTQRLIDTHGTRIAPEVWSLYQYALTRLGAIPTCLEWDTDIPQWPTMLSEIELIRNQLKTATPPANITSHPPINNTTAIPPESLIQFQNKLWNTLLAKQDITNKNGFSVHQHSMRIQRRQALQHVYPCTQQCLTRERFECYALTYIIKTPSISADITQHTHSFCDYLNTVVNSDEHYIVDLARYEWQWHCVFHNVNHDSIDLNKLIQMIENVGEDIHLQQSAGCRLIQCNSPALDIWQSCQEEYQGPDTATLLQTRITQPCYYALHQRQSFVVAIELNAAAHDSLQLLTTPLTLKHWCERSAKLPDFHPEMAAYFYQNGLIELSNTKGTLL